MTYDEAIEATVSKAQAQREIAKHDCGEGAWDAFIADVGDKATYTGAEVLGWLGY